MDDEVKSDTSYDMQVIPRPVKLFHNLRYEESLYEQSMTSLSTETTVSSGLSACNLVWEIYLLCINF